MSEATGTSLDSKESGPLGHTKRDYQFHRRARLLNRIKMSKPDPFMGRKLFYQTLPADIQWY